MLIWKTSGPQIWDSSVNPPLNRTKASWEEYFFVMSNALKPQPGATKKTKTQRGGHGGSLGGTVLPHLILVTKYKMC